MKSPEVMNPILTKGLKKLTILKNLFFVLRIDKIIKHSNDNFKF